MKPTQSATSLISLAAVTWDFALVGRTRMLTEAWLRSEQDTTFVQVPSLRTALEKFSGHARRDGGAPVVRPWPAYPARWWSHISEATLLRLVRRRANALRKQLDRITDIRAATAIVISPVWTPWLDSLPFKHIVYDCIDDVSVHVQRPELTRLYRRWENELVERAAGAVVTAEPLIESLRTRRPDMPIATIRNGVDVERFQNGAKNSPRPTDLPDGKRSIVGFVGALYDWIDWNLIAAVADAMPAADFVFVGPHGRGAHTSHLQRAANIHFLGARPYAEVPAYMQAFDVCWVPFDRSKVSRAANPVKIYEYLALGKQVVTTPVADTDSFDDHVRVGTTTEEIVSHLQSALSQPHHAFDERVRFAQANSWAARAADYVAFARELEPRGAEDRS